MMKRLNKTMVALIIASVLTGSAVTVLAANAKNDGKPFEGQVVKGTVMVKQFPHQVQIGSIHMKDGNEQAMSKQARISAEEAAQIAAKALPGKVVESQLGEENGYLIWEVSMLSADGKESQLKLDAGNGRLLAVEAGSDERDEGNYEDNDHAQNDNDREDNNSEQKGGEREDEDREAREEKG